jgi:peptidoglycan/LPS O-acetylase OafA/YrhL
VAAYLLIVPQPRPVTSTNWIEHLTLTQVYGFGRFAEGFGHTWSLCTEVAFYAVLPFVGALVLAGKWRPMRVIAVLVAAGLTITVGWVACIGLGLLDSSPDGLWLPSYAGWFAAGMALAIAHVALATSTAPKALRVLDELASAPMACWTIAVALLAVATTPLAGPRDLNSPGTGEFAAKLILYMLIAVMMLLPLAFGPKDRVTRAFASRPARWLGTVSYGLFLWHPFVIALIYRPGGRQIFTGDLISTFALVLGAGLLLAVISYYLIERPFLVLAHLGG